jgi:hypothetical protein
MGFFSPAAGPNLPPLKTNNPGEQNNWNITETGYCFIVPTPGGYSVKTEQSMSNTHIRMSERYTSAGYSDVDYIKLPLVPTISQGSANTIRILVNDLALSGHWYINTWFARAISSTAVLDSVSIRTPQQMRDISRLGTTAGITFTQELDLDFARFADPVRTQPFMLTTPVVTGEFRGIFNGNGFIISNVNINAPTYDNIGLFSRNSGVLDNITLNTVNITGNNNVGGIVGQNLGEVNNTALTDVNITGNDNVGGLVGYNHSGAVIVAYLLDNVVVNANTDNAGQVVGFDGNEIIEP